MQKVCIVMLSLLMIFSSIPAGMADEVKTFSDVNPDHWAYDAIMIMSDRGIIEGYEDGTFKPSNEITRSQFSKMMIKTLALEEIARSTPSFIDVGPDHWAYKYIEGSKTYLTGYRTADGDLFKPDDASVREDLAVALVKALGFTSTNAPLSELEVFEDQGLISTNLRPYMAHAVSLGFFQGEVIEGKKYLKPQSPISRAETAQLLVRILKDQGVIEKVTYDDEKVTYDNEMTLKIVEQSPGRIKVAWTPVAKESFKYYKVVLSQSDKTPEYPDQGSYRVIDDYDETTAVIEAGDKYYNGDFGDKIKTGEYYLSITALLNDGKVTSNVIPVVLVYEEDDASNASKTPKLELARHDGHGMKLEWSTVPSSGFKYYKVVLSTSDGSPIYPDNGYAKSIGSVNENYAYVEIGDHYNNGDFGNTIVSGDYYVAISAVYESGTYASNVLKVSLEGNDGAQLPEVTTPELSVTRNNDDEVKVSWSTVSNTGFTYYKVVISKENSNPKYPDDGYLTYFSDASRSYAEIPVNKEYNGGDFGGKLNPGEYYVTVTAVFKSGKYTSNTVKINLLADD